MILTSAFRIDDFTNLLSDEELKRLEESSTITNYAASQVIFYEATNPYGVYFLESGRIKLYKTGGQGKNQIFQICSAGDIFGFHPVILGEAYPDSAATLEDCTIRFVPRQVFLDLVKESNKLSFYTLQRLCAEFRDFISQETIIAQKPVLERVAVILLSLAEVYKNGEEQIVIPLSRQDLADLCGTAKETLVRELKVLKDSNLIKSESGRDILILDQKGLENLAKF